MNHGGYTGRLTKDFESKGKTGMGTIAVARPYPYDKDKDGNKVTDFLTFKIIGEKQCSSAANYLKKGTSIEIQGITCRDSWKDKDGNWRESNYIMVTEWGFTQGNTKDNNAGSTVSNINDFMSIPDGIDAELPFN